MAQSTASPAKSAAAAMPAVRIPFNKPYLAGTEFGYIGEAISFGHTAGDRKSVV